MSESNTTTAETEVRHTPEPWRVYLRGRDGHEIHTDDTVVCCLHDDSRDTLSPDPRGGPDARRIVACVNACEGINPDAVPDLLAAARELVKDVHGCGLDESMIAAVSACAAAIARAEGGAA